jgi:hypothetical protein
MGQYPYSLLASSAPLAIISPHLPCCCCLLTILFLHHLPPHHHLPYHLTPSLSSPFVVCLPCCRLPSSSASLAVVSCCRLPPLPSSPFIICLPHCHHLPPCHHLPLSSAPLAIISLCCLPPSSPLSPPFIVISVLSLLSPLVVVSPLVALPCCCPSL